MKVWINQMLLLLSSVVLYGCFFAHPASESAFAVKGKIVFDRGEELASGCNLELYRQMENRKVGEVGISSEFEKSFVIAPGSHAYYMVVRCPGGWIYKTSPYHLGTVKQWVRAIDLGEIHLAHIGD